MPFPRWLGLVCTVLLSPLAMAQDGPPLKFNDVKEVAPGVFFRYSSISASDPKVPFGGCNNIWVVFQDYVVVFDANFPKEAGDVIQAIRKTTNKPIRYVVDSHHHGDHAWGNAIWAKEGASIIGQRRCFDWLKTKGNDEFTEGGKGPTGRKDVAQSKLKVPDLVFDDKLVLDDGTQRVEIYHFGHCHTPGDAVMYLPGPKILCTGDACVNGAYNYMGHSDSAAWIRNLEKMAQLDIKQILPGHGLPTGKDLLGKQRRYFVELRDHVQKGVTKNPDIEEIIKTTEIPWYKEWTEVEAKSRVDNIKHVYGELTGTVLNWEFVEDYGIYEGKSPTKETAGWKKPRRIILPNLMPARVQELKRVAPEVSFVPVKTEEEAIREAGDADAILGFGSSAIVKAGKNLRWMQVRGEHLPAEVGKLAKDRKILVTSMAQVQGSDVAEQTFSLLLGLARKAPGGGENNGPKPRQLQGQTLAVVGLGATGLQIARRAHAFGMKVIGIEEGDKAHMEAFLFQVSPLSQLMEILPQADVVVLACPLSPKTQGMMAADQFKALKANALLINAGRSELLRFPPLVEALENKALGGAGLGLTHPWPEPWANQLKKFNNVIVNPGLETLSEQALDRRWRFLRENVRRFVQGEPMLGVVEE